MANCEHYQAQLLGYLYELLETNDQRALQDHLMQCAACQAALMRAERHKKLLGVAAKAEFPAVRFEPPPAGQTVPAADAPPELFRLGRKSWLGWAVAASVLLLLGVGGSATICAATACWRRSCSSHWPPPR